MENEKRVREMGKRRKVGNGKERKRGREEEKIGK